MTVAELWRYPVKSMSGEPLEQASIGPLGIVGDRVVHLEDARGRFLTARTHPRLLGHRATLDRAGEPLIDGLPWTHPQSAQIALEIGGPGARFVRDDSAERFDVLPLLVATDGAIALFHHDGRRLRPNLVIAGVESLDERSWPGHRLQIGDALIGIQDLRARCVMTTYDPDTQKQDLRILKEIVRDFHGKLALNAYVIEPATIRIGDPVHLLPHDHPAAAETHP